jgi:hypothetical protein
MNTENNVREVGNEGIVPPPTSESRRGPGRQPGDERWSRNPVVQAAERVAAYYPDDPRRKSPALATIMSLMPGLGQVYVGYYQQGFTNVLVVATIITLLAQSNHIGLNGMEPLLGVFLAFFWLYNLVDAGRRASFYNQALAGMEKPPLADELALPTGGGALAGGVALVLAGVIVFSNTMFGVSLEWLREWWPLGLVAIGGYLIYSSIRDRRGRRSGSSAGDVAAQ